VTGSRAVSVRSRRIAFANVLGPACKLSEGVSQSILPISEANPPILMTFLATSRSDSSAEDTYGLDSMWISARRCARNSRMQIHNGQEKRDVTRCRTCSLVYTGTLRAAYAS
jgi:hypothetical protein